MSRRMGWLPSAESARDGQSLRRFISLANILTLVWLVVVYWKERISFRQAVSSCDWRHWENWPPGAAPHHVLLVADPQLVDPHTYPGRPWPLSTLTVRYADLYLSRVYGLLQKNLYPDSTIFLGDLFDGGREWGTAHSSSPEKRWARYGESYWHKEYKRFSRIFFDPWIRAGVAGREGQLERRQIYASLPGNHDLGFAAGVTLPVRNRFNAYFGESNRIDMVGNHTFVSIDTVSLSAKGDEGDVEEIWKPAMDFLETIDNKLNRTASDHLRLQNGLHAGGLYKHEVVEHGRLASAALPDSRLPGTHQFPTILLTHVPLFRDQGTPCGPMREHWPPSYDSNGKPLKVDDRNSITVARGYQYQNVLSLDISKEITSAIQNLSYAFSGDDHDYCEVLHRRYPSAGGGIHETTVKSISLAMSVRKPGVQLLSLWNPINNDLATAGSQESLGSKATLQSHLCLLPDQLGIFIGYGLLLIATFVLLGSRAAHLALNPSKSSFNAEESPILPISRSPRPEKKEKAESSSSDDGVLPYTRRNGLSARLTTARSRSSSPRPSAGYGLPAFGKESSSPAAHNGFVPSSNHFRDGGRALSIDPRKKSKSRRLGGFALFRAELSWSILRVALIGFPWYLWLVWNG